ncbi:hypothetical protein [Aquipuribacter nitratireducens]|uniref:Uncharacterized protein n=1 Tax=Aquipuribacter nitratireducens TaxID=650104 RepID=A0ABW0GJF3_9MICO
MSVFARAPRLPEPVVRAASLEPGERVLAVSRVEGGWTFATTHRLHVVTTLGADGAPDTARAVRWVDVRTATTVPEERLLDVRLVDGARWAVPVGHRPRRLPETVRERVQNSVVQTYSVDVGRGRSVHVVARRTPEEQVSLQVSADRGVDLSEPEVATSVARARDALRRELGLPD